VDIETAAYFREKAVQCRRLAGHIVLDGDSAKAELLAMAREFEAKAAAIEARVDREPAILQLKPGV
jgi:hypothetical protein